MKFFFFQDYTFGDAHVGQMWLWEDEAGEHGPFQTFDEAVMDAGEAATREEPSESKAAEAGQ